MTGARIAIFIFWLAATGWLIRCEAFPHWFSGAGSDYRTILREGPVIRDAWMRIDFQETPIGYSHTWVDSDVASMLAATTIRNRTELALNVMGREQTLLALISAELDTEHRLQRFYASVLAAGTETRVEGRRHSGDEFTVELRIGRSRQTMTMTLPADVLIHSPAIEMALAALQPGESLRARVLDPLSLTVSDIQLEALRREAGAIVVRTRYQGMESHSWIDGEGQILRQETQLGWTLTRCSAEEALAIKPGAASDIAAFLAVPCRGGDERMLKAHWLALRLNGATINTQNLASARQTVMGIDEQTGGLNLHVRAQAEPSKTAAIGQYPDSVLPWLAASAALPADDPVLKDKARSIIGNETNAWPAAQKLNQWVYHNLLKEPTVSLPAALDVLERGAGDCNEHTVLLVALARAAGIPARIHAGLVYSAAGSLAGAFYYHAWPAVYVGEWVEMEPTHGYDLVGATHLAVTEGELSGQLGLLGLIGKTSIDILDWEAAAE